MLPPFQLKEFTANSLRVINEMGKLVSAMHPSCMSLYQKNNKIDLSFQTNILSLLECSETTEIIEARFVKQRSEIWAALRKSAYVTGSTIYDAVDMRGIKKKKKSILQRFLRGNNKRCNPMSPNG